VEHGWQDEHSSCAFHLRLAVVLVRELVSDSSGRNKRNENAAGHGTDMLD